MQLVDPVTMRDLIRSRQMHQQLMNQPTISALLEIEKAMQNVNQRTDLSAEQKHGGYCQLLKKFNNFHHDMYLNKPPPTVLSNDPSLQPTQPGQDYLSPTNLESATLLGNTPVPYSSSASAELSQPAVGKLKPAYERVLSGAPPRYRQKTQMILQAMQNSPSLSFSEDRAEISVDGRHVSASNLYELLQLLNRNLEFNNGRTERPRGMKEFLLALAKTNLPAFAIINSSLKKELLSYREDAAKHRDMEQKNRDVLQSLHALGGKGAGQHHNLTGGGVGGRGRGGGGGGLNPFVWHTLDGLK